jgi:hypothetical protein
MPEESLINTFTTTAQLTKQNAKMLKLTEFWSENQFQAILKIAAVFKNLCKFFSNFLNFTHRSKCSLLSSKTSHIGMLDVYVLQHVVKSVVKTVYVYTLFMIVVVTAVMDTSAGMLSENPQEFLSTYMCM